MSGVVNQNHPLAYHVMTAEEMQSQHPLKQWFRRHVTPHVRLTFQLENKGSVARDHLANERTFLAWLRTSLSLITVGVAVAQLFRLQQAAGGHSYIDDSSTGKAIGVSLVVLGMVFILFGLVRYFVAQGWMIEGKFPASRGIVVIASFSVLVVMLALLIAVASSVSQTP
jgi:uncharacterized membrane protein YidH (DUF202 family)